MENVYTIFQNYTLIMELTHVLITVLVKEIYHIIWTFLNKSNYLIFW